MSLNSTGGDVDVDDFEVVDGVKCKVGYDVADVGIDVGVVVEAVIVVALDDAAKYSYIHFI